jgi:hypothetical protein
LRCWRPRRPSATLKWRLLPARIASVPRLLRVAGWLTPATACVLLALLSVSPENALPVTGPRSPSILAMLSNQNYAVAVTSRQSVQNNLSVFTSDWTNHDDSGSTLRFTPIRKPTE